MTRSPILILLVAAIVPTLSCGLLNTAVRSPQVASSEATIDLSPAPESFSLVTPHPDQRSLTGVLATNAGRAAGLGRRPFVEFSADLCPPCVALAESLGDPRMAQAFKGTYIIRLDYDEWKDRPPGTGFTVVGTPTFFELDSSGGPTGRMITGAA